MQTLSRYSLFIVVLSGVVLFLPSLGNGFLADDVYHMAILEGFDRLDDVGPFSLYTFEEGKPERMGQIQGRLPPWWASNDFRQNFFRPVSCLFHVIDHALYGRNPVGYHITNLLLWGILLAVVIMLYRELARDFGLSLVTVLLAGLLFALDEAHVLNVAWLAHRYALLGSTFCVASLLHYHRFRRDGNVKSMLWALLLLGLGLFSDEGSTGLVLWVFAYELCLRKDPPGKRILVVTPLVALVASYLLMYKLLGYGAAGSDNYLDPFSNPLKFLHEGLLERLPFLITGALTPVPAQLSFARIAHGDLWPLLVACILGCTVVLLFVPHLRRERTARFMALGALLVMLPRVAAFAHNRMLLLPTVGTAWLLASYVTTSPRPIPAADKKTTETPIWFSVKLWFRRILIVLILGFHGLVSPVQALFETRGYRQESQRQLKMAMEAELPGPGEARDARVLMLSTPSLGYNNHAGLRWLSGIPYPEAVWGVTTGKGEYYFKRTGPASFTIRMNFDGFLRGIEPRHCWEGIPFKVGSKHRQGAMEVTITEMEKGEIREISVSIDRPLNDPKVWLVFWNGERLVRRRVPPWISSGR